MNRQNTPPELFEKITNEKITAYGLILEMLETDIGLVAVRATVGSKGMKELKRIKKDFEDFFEKNKIKLNIINGCGIYERR